MNTLIISTSPYSCHVSKYPLLRNRLCWPKFRGTSLKIQASANEADTQATVEESSQNEEPLPEPKETNKLSSTAPPPLDKDLKKVTLAHTIMKRVIYEYMILICASIFIFFLIFFLPTWFHGCSFKLS